MDKDERWIYGAKLALYVSLGIMLFMIIYPLFVSSIGTATGVYAPFKLFKESLLFGLLAILLGCLTIKKEVSRKFFSDKLNIAIALYIAITLFFTLLTFRQGEIEAAASGFLMNTRFLVIFVVIMLTLHFLKKKVIEGSIQKFIKYFLITSFGISVFAIMQVTILPASFLEIVGYNGVTTPPPYSTVDNNISVLRAFSTMWAPNMLGSFLLLPLALFFVLFLQNYRNIYAGVSLIIIFLAIFATHSRSAIFAALITLFLVLLFQKGNFVMRHFKVFLLSLVVIVIGIAFASTYPPVRLLVFHSSEGDVSLTEGSTNDHFIAIQKNLIDAAQYPLGQGVGTAGPSSFQLSNSPPKIAESYFIQLAQEVGVMGLLLFCYISAVVGWRLYGLSTVNNNVAAALFASFIAINFINLFLHGWADDPTSIVWWGFAALALYTPQGISTGKKEFVYEDGIIKSYKDRHIERNKEE